MRSVKTATLAICAMAMIGTTSAFANGNVTSSDCRAKQQQVEAALEANASSTNYAAAVKERDTARTDCTASQYAWGVSHYDAALKLLGTS
jgi:hypothetical protein